MVFICYVAYKKTGFSYECWYELKDALYQHVLKNSFVEMSQTLYGENQAVATLPASYAGTVHGGEIPHARQLATVYDHRASRR